MSDVFKRITDKYGSVDPLTGGFTNMTYLIKSRKPLVAKIAAFSNEDLLNEKTALHHLKETALVPEFVDILTEETPFILITSFEEGMNGQAILDAGNMERANSLFYKMGERLARDIHFYHFKDHKTPLRQGGWTFFPKIPFVSQDLINKSRPYMDVINDNPAEWVLTHGDYGAHNILFHSGDQLKVIDWEWSEWFHPLVDIAWTCWNTKLHYADIADPLNQTFIRAYKSVNPLPSITDEEIKAYALYKIWNILKRIPYDDKATIEKWSTRMQWTFSAKIIQGSL